MNRKKEKGFALVLSLVLLLVMSLMGGSLIVITSTDHQSNNNSDQYQQAFYVAETGLMQGEKWVIDQYLGPWTKTSELKTANDAITPPDGTTAAEIAEYNAQKDAYDAAIANYHTHSNNMTRYEYLRGPPLNDLPSDTDLANDVELTKTNCMKSFKNIAVDKKLQIAGGGSLPKKVNFINIVGPILLNESCDGDYLGCTSYKADFLVEKTDAALGFSAKANSIAKKEVQYLKRFEYEFFVINVGAAAYQGSGASVAKTTSGSGSQGTAYKIYACGIFYGKSEDDADDADAKPHNGNIEILIPLETIIVMPS